MNFDLSEEQQLLSDSVARFVNDQYPLDQRQLTVLSEQGFSSEHWQTMAELGWLGASIPEQYQGFGGNQADTMVLWNNWVKAWFWNLFRQCGACRERFEIRRQ